MKCFYHPDVDAVGTCAQCSKTACRQCIEDVGGALLCAGCLSLHQQQAQYEEHVATVDRETTIQRAKTRILWSWIVGGIGIVFGIFPGIIQATAASQQNNLGAAAVILLPLIVIFFMVFSGYMFWSMFWGTPVVWGWTKTAIGSLGFSFYASLPVWVIILSCCISLPISVDIYYSIFGGGIYQFFKWRRIAAGNF